MNSHIMNIDIIKNKMIEFIPRLFIFFLIIKISLESAKYIKYKIIDIGLEKITQNIPSDEKYSNKNKANMLYYAISNIAYYLITIIGIIIAFINLGVQVATILTIFGTLALGIGLSMQGTLINIISGIYIGLNNIFVVGDVISFQDKIGRVKEMTLLTTILVNMDTKERGEILIPNNLFQTNLVKNLSR